jgi:hypothetical protein
MSVSAFTFCGRTDPGSIAARSTAASQRASVALSMPAMSASPTALASRAAARSVSHLVAESLASRALPPIVRVMHVL